MQINEWQLYGRWRFGLRRQQAFLQDLHGLLEDGVSIQQALQALAQLTRGATQQVAHQAMQSLAEGRGFADGLQAWFTPYIVAIIKAGEQGGTFLQAMQVAAQALTQRSQLVVKMLSILLYPCVVLVMGCAVSVFMQHSVMQSFAQIKPVTEWPELGQSLYYFALFIERFWWLLGVVFVLLMISIGFGLRMMTGSARQFLDAVPLISLYRRWVAVRLLSLLGLLLSNGVGLRHALGLCHQYATPYLRWHLSHMEARLSYGQDNIADVLHTGLVGQEDMIRLRVVAKGRGFASALLRLGSHAETRLQQHIEVVLRLLSGVLLVLAAALAGVMVLAIYGVGSYVGT